MALFSLTKDNDYASRKAAIARQEKLAEMLSQMGAQEQAVSTAGGITAPVSGMGALARGLTSFGGSYLSGSAAADAAALEKAEREAAREGMKSFYELPETTILADKMGAALPNYLTADAEAMAAGPAAQNITVAGGPRSRASQVRMANEFALGDNEVLARMAPALLAQTKPEDFAGSEFGRFSRDAEGNITQIQAPMVAKTSTKNPYPAIGKDGKPAMFRDDEFGNPIPVPGMTPYSSPGTTVRVDMPKPASAFSSSFGSELGKDAMTTITAGRKAPGIIDSADRVIKVLSDQKIKPITGTFAETKLLVSKALYGDTPEAAATENLIADLAKSTLDAIPASGLGGGQGFTERDKQFLIVASAGRVQETKENLLRMAKLRKIIGAANIKNANKTMKQISAMPGYAEMAGLLQPIPESAGTAPQGVDQRTWDNMTPEEKALFK